MPNTTPTILQSVRTALRISTQAFDSELENLIGAAKADLARMGVKSSYLEAEMSYPEIVQAIIAYCKAKFGENTNAEHWEQIYGELKGQISNAGVYRT